jgi:hypothetical protein
MPDWRSDAGLAVAGVFVTGDWRRTKDEGSDAGRVVFDAGLW